VESFNRSTNEAVEHLAAFQTLLHYLPEKHRLLIQGPNKDGSWSVGVVAKTTPSQQIVSCKGPLTEALMAAAVELVVLKGE